MSYAYLRKLREVANREYSTLNEKDLAEALTIALDDIEELRKKLDNASDNLADIMRAARDAQREVA